LETFGAETIFRTEIQNGFFQKISIVFDENEDDDFVVFGKKLLKMTEECTFYCLPHNEIRHYSTQFFFLNSFCLAKATKTFFGKKESQ